MEYLTPLQDLLGFVHCTNPAFSSNASSGRVGFVGLLFGCLMSSSLSSFLISTLLLSSPSVSSSLPIQLQILLPPLQQFSLFGFLLSLFHVLEFVATALYTPHSCTSTSFLLDHSPSYTAALLFSWTEYLIRCLLSLSPYTSLYVGVPRLSLVSYVGLALVLCGQCLRFVAMRTCGPSFNHIIQEKQRQGHTLITHGVYSVLRHPSYCGWFYWSVGTQLLLGNPISSAVYAAASCSFFRARIPFEEATLMLQYGNGVYEEYAKNTYIGIPFVKGMAGKMKKG